MLIVRLGAAQCQIRDLVIPLSRSKRPTSLSGRALHGSYLPCRFLISASASGIDPRGLSFNSGYRSSHWLSASSDLKRFITPQPPPINSTADPGSTLFSLPCTNTTWIRVVLSGEDVSSVTTSLVYLLLTSSNASIAQFTLKRLPRPTVTVWKMKSRRGSHLRYRGTTL